MAIPLHLRTPSRRLVKALPCQRRRSPSRHIISTTRILDILRIGRRTQRALATRPRPRRVLQRRLSAPVR